MVYGLNYLKINPRWFKHFMLSKMVKW
uniref:Uncharacterized protein n=1 Tax=Rhizophora mucronata TaxID=61149 RepID=A0A2P2QTP0_RHIMU